MAREDVCLEMRERVFVFYVGDSEGSLLYWIVGSW